MAGFDEAWLRAYNGRRSTQVIPAAPDVLHLTLKRPTITLNELMRMHWKDRRKLAAAVSSELGFQLPMMSGLPMERARVTIKRFSIREIDDDNLRGAKLLVDCLLPNSGKHPHGLGLVFDDSPTHMDQIMTSVLVKTMREQRTEIIIERLT